MIRVSNRHFLWEILGVNSWDWVNVTCYPEANVQAEAKEDWEVRPPEVAEPEEVERAFGCVVRP